PPAFWRRRLRARCTHGYQLCVHCVSCAILSQRRWLLPRKPLLFPCQERMVRNLLSIMDVSIQIYEGGLTMSRSQKFWIVVFTLLAAGAVAQEIYAQVRLQQLMAIKLQNAQKLLEGIALNKFDKIEKHAEELVRISKTAEWLAVHKTPRYEQFSNEFQ